ncbi:NAD-dependent epimerase/dehydratase family protein [Candidatus Kaiserbacteria bacterium]|nr:NAD-dependent epimerase/dehydratase family protein [Candidatus Kaiserbacteria bacterium]
MKVGITGGNGLIGLHLRALLHARGEDADVSLISREDFSDEKRLQAAVKDCDVVLHAAAATRGDDREIYETNIRLTNALIHALEKTGRKQHVILTSTVQIEKDTGYGKSKRENGEALVAWGARAGAPVSVLVIPNVFGEFAKPYHNTVVATFCDQLVKGEESRVAPDISVRLMHAQDVAERLRELMETKETGILPFPGGTDITVEDIYRLLSGFHTAYQSSIALPQTRSLFERRLFNMYRSALPLSFYPRPFAPRSDRRGDLFEMAQVSSPGQIFMSTTKPGQVRGNHWHMRKMERFALVRGEARMKVRKLFSNEAHTYELSGNRPAFVDTGTFSIHALENAGTDELVTAFWADEIFNPGDPDSFAEVV